MTNRTLRPALRDWKTLLLLAAVLTVTAPACRAVEGRLMRWPDIHSQTVVFTYEDDLWSAPAEGGAARRLTSHPGVEERASFSPDGKWIAFTGSYDGGNDVYVIPAGGGEPRRLTWHPSYDAVTGWTPDGAYVTFVSRRGLEIELYRVPLEGGYPEKYPLDRVWYASFSPDGKRVAFNRFSSDRMNWKGYRGGAQQDIWIADADGGKFEKITDWPGYDNAPMWRGGQIFFNSDREDGRMNIYAYDTQTGRVTRCTKHTGWDVEFPAIGSERIVYCCEGYLWIYDIITAASSRVEIEIPSDRWQMRDTYISPGGYVQELSPGSDGTRVVVQARGDIYLLHTEIDDAVNLTRTPGSRELYPVLSPKADTVAFFSDRTGEYELYIAPARPGAQWTQITSGSKTWYYYASWSPDGTKILFGDKDFRIFTADVATKKVREIDRCLYQKDNEIFWETSDYAWSPDSRWIVYSKTGENLNSSIFVHDLEKWKTWRLTDDRYDDYSPCFDPGGRYIWFLSLRNFTPELDWFMDNNVCVDQSMVMAMQLHAGEKPPFAEDESGDPIAVKAQSADSAGAAVRIDFEGIDSRIFAVPVPPGTYKALSVWKGSLAWLSRAGYGFPGIEEFFNPKGTSFYDLQVFDIKEKTVKTILPGIGSYTLSADGSHVTYLSGPMAGIVKTDAVSAAGDGALKWAGLRQRIDVFAEYPQIYRDVWRQIRDFFYDPGIHGKDWQAVYDKYEPLIPYVATRADMNYIIGQMIGELTASHEYIVGPGDPPRTYWFRVNTGLIGADLEPDAKSGWYRFARIVDAAGWEQEIRNPLLSPEIELSEGDYLIAIDGEQVTTARNWLSHLENRAGREIEITISSKPDTAGARTYTIEALYSEYPLRYYEQVEDRYRHVREATGGRVGYMHLADMDEEGLQEFEQGFRAERYRDGLIIDVRGNGGGFVSWFIIDKLERALMYMTVTRDFIPMRYPHGVVTGPMIVLCDQDTGSDGEVFSQHFKDLGLGTVVGTPTWGGLIGIINMIPLTDGGMVTQSNVGFANLQGEWVVENRGVIPDIIVENDPADLVKGIDRQLDEAIRLILEQIAVSPPAALEPPPFPRK